MRVTVNSSLRVAGMACFAVAFFAEPWLLLFPIGFALLMYGAWRDWN